MTSPEEKYKLTIVKSMDFISSAELSSLTRPPLQSTISIRKNSPSVTQQQEGYLDASGYGEGPFAPMGASSRLWALPILG